MTFKKFIFTVYAGLNCCFAFIFGMEELQLSREHPLIVTSGEANYDGQDITLVGDVSVQHALGKILAKNLSIYSSKTGDKKNKFSMMNICDQVEVEFYKGGKISCSQAQIDYENMNATFSGTSDYPDVVYVNVGEETTSGSTIPFLEIKSSSFSVGLVKEPVSGFNYSYALVDYLQSSDQVEANYVSLNQTFNLKAAQAIYQKLVGKASSYPSGLLTLSSKEGVGSCLLQTLNGDRLNADEIQLNSVEKQLLMTNVKGVLSFDQSGLQAQSIELDSDKVIWDDHEEVLSLFGLVRITQNGTIQIKTDQQMSIVLGKFNNKSFLRSIHIPQRTEIVYLDASNQVKHSMSCPGSLMMDHEKQQIVLKSLEKSLENQDSHQVYIDDELGELYADEVKINYEWNLGKFIPNKVELKGNVRLLNRFDGHVQEAASILHYAMADQIDYYPKTFELVLRGNEKDQVLFYDKVNQIQMSASSLKMKIDPITRKEFIQGVGNVRFTFLDQELQQIKKSFRLDSIKGAE